MSDTADAQGDFVIERVADAGDDRQGGELRAARDADKRDPSLETAGDAAPPEKAAPMAREDGFPDRVRRKYYVVAEERTKEGAALNARVYADERGEYLAFKATEDRLTTRLASAQVIHDMIAVAEHRNWQVIHLRGSVEFRREAWLEASAREIVVKGYEPTEIDRQALASRRAARERANRRPTESRDRSNPDRAKRGDRFDSRNTADRARNNVTVIDNANGKPRADRRQVPQDRSAGAGRKIPRRRSEGGGARRRPRRSTITARDCRKSSRTRLPSRPAGAGRNLGSGEGANRPAPRARALFRASDGQGANAGIEPTAKREGRGPSKP